MMKEEEEEPTSLSDVTSHVDFARLIRSRWRCLTMQEMSGATGDLGTFLPLLLNMARVVDDKGAIVNFSSAMFWAGVANVFTGMLWDSPIPVQPMKTIAAVAITEELTKNELIGAGLSVSIAVFLLGQTGLIETINYLIPLSIVKGLQLGLGITMAVKGLELMTELPFAKDPDSILLTIVCTAFTLLALSLRRKKRIIPAALILVIVGLFIAVIRTFVIGDLEGRPDVPVELSVSDLSFNDVLRGFWFAGFAQLPLTTLNSVVSICDLNNENYFKNNDSKKMTRRSVARSVGLMNLCTLPFGSIPMCHGAGGLAAQYQFGARGGSSIMFLGFMKILFAVLSGSTASMFLENYPHAILGVLLFFSGLGLSKAGITPISSSSTSQGKNDSELMVILSTASATVCLKTGWGCFFGICFSLFYGGFDNVLEDLKKKKFWCCGGCGESKERAISELPAIRMTTRGSSSDIRATKGSDAC